MHGDLIRGTIVYREEHARSYILSPELRPLPPDPFTNEEKNKLRAAALKQSDQQQASVEKTIEENYRLATTWDQWAIEALVSRIEYKPGWTLTVLTEAKLYEPAFAGYRNHTDHVLTMNPNAIGTVGVLLVAEVPDRQYPGVKTRVEMVRKIPTGRTYTREDYIKIIFRMLILPMEQHEMAEFYRFDGQLVNDPHKEDTKP